MPDTRSRRVLMEYASIARTHRTHNASVTLHLNFNNNRARTNHQARRRALVQQRLRAYMGYVHYRVIPRWSLTATRRETATTTTKPHRRRIHVRCSVLRTLQVGASSRTH